MLNDHAVFLLSLHGDASLLDIMAQGLFHVDMFTGLGRPDGHE
jgi:hypothetical protein